MAILADFKYFKFINENLNFELIHLNHADLDSSWNEYNVASPFNRLYIILDGYGYLENKSRNEKIDLEKGYIYLIPANSTYDYFCPNKLNKIFIHFNLNIVPNKDIFQDVLHCQKQTINLSLLSELKDLFYSDNVSDSLLCKSIILNIISKFIATFGLELTEEIELYRKYSGIYDCVKNHSSANLTTEEVANHAGLSLNYLSRKFKQDTGITIKEYMDNILIQNLKKDLMFSGKTIKEISIAYDFNSQFYFSRFFKKHTGMSPSTFKSRSKHIMKV